MLASLLRLTKSLRPNAWIGFSFTHFRCTAIRYNPAGYRPQADTQHGVASRNGDVFYAGNRADVGHAIG